MIKPKVGRTIGSILTLLFLANAAHADWMEIRPRDRVNVDAITAVEILTDSAGAVRASIWLPSRQDSTTDSGLITKLKALVSSADWLWVREAAAAGATSLQYVHKVAIQSILLNCPMGGTCTALLQGIESSFSGVVANRTTAVNDLKALGTGMAFVLAEGDHPGFELYLRKSSIQRIQFTCPAMGACTAANVEFICGDPRVTRDAAGIAQLLTVSK